jgi:hypothetical protein
LVESGQTRMCTGCGRQIPVEYNVCPHCGRPQNTQQQYGPQPQPYGQPNQPPQESVGALKYLLYIVSLIIWPIGFIIGIIWLGAGSDPEKKHIGKMCLILAVVGIILDILCWVVLAALSIAVMGF